MNRSHRLFWKLLAVAVVALVAALWSANTRRPLSESETRATSEAVPGLMGRLGSLDRVELRSADGVIATLERRDDAWWLTERDYPADSSKLRSLLLGIAEARRVEQKTSNPELYSKLGVEDVEKEGARGVQVSLQGGGEPLAFILGDNTGRGSGTYLRLVGDAASWQIDRNAAVEKTTSNWLQQELTDVLPGRVERVTVQYGKDRIEIQADSSRNGDFVVANLPKGREQASDFVADATAGLLQGLRLDDVAEAASMVIPEQRRESQFVLRDGLQIEVASWEVDGKTWARLTASFDEVRADAAIDAEQGKARSEWEAKQAAKSETPASKPEADAAAADAAATSVDAGESATEAPLAVRDPAADREQRLSALREELAGYERRFAGRLFQLPSYKAANLNRDLEAYLKPKA